MGHALVEYGSGRIRVNTLSLEAAMAVLAHVVRSNKFEPSPALSEWLILWVEQVSLYGVAYFHLDLDRLLADDAVLQEFLRLLAEGIAWTSAQGEVLPSSFIYEVVGGEHWKQANMKGWASEHVIRTLTDLRRLINEAG